MIRLTFYTIDEAAARVKRTRRTIERWIDQGLRVDVLDGRQYVREDLLLTAYRDALTRAATRLTRSAEHGTL